MLRILHYDELSRRCAGERTYEKRRPGSSLTMNAGLLSLSDSRVAVLLGNARLSLCTSTHNPKAGRQGNRKSPLLEQLCTFRVICGRSENYRLR
jgi:hypothetical protein